MVEGKGDMKYNIYIYKVRAKLLLMMSVAILLSACSDDTDRVPGETDILQIAAYTKNMNSPSLRAETRTVTYPDDYSEYKGSASIGVFMTLPPATDNDKIPEMTLISYEDNAWHSMVKVTENIHYNIYGFMPAYVTCEISKITGKEFQDGAVLTFTDVPSVMTEDFSVITGVLQLESDQANPPRPVEEGTLKAGTFAYTGQGNGKNFVDLMFDHLYGALNISLKVDPEYAALRTIKLKELKLKTSDANGPSKSKTTVTVTLNKTDGTSPIAETGGIVFTPDPTSDDMGDETFFLSATGKELTTTDQSFMGHFMPYGITSFVLTSIYDVYDKNDNLIRQGCTAENKLEIGKLYDRQTKTQRGWKYNVNMIIKPTYLYMLSDPDLDNPSFIIEN